MRVILKYLLFILFFAVLIAGYIYMDVSVDASYDETLSRVWRGMALVFIGGVGSLATLYRIVR